MHRQGRERTAWSDRPHGSGFLRQAVGAENMDLRSPPQRSERTATRSPTNASRSSRADPLWTGRLEDMHAPQIIYWMLAAGVIVRRG
jgi:hypothetical protein